MTITICLKLEQEKPLVLLLCVFGKFIFMNFVPMRIQRWLLIQIHLSFFFLSGFFSRTMTTDKTAREGRGTSFIPLYHFHPLTNIHTFILQLCMFDDHHIFLIALLIFTRLLLDEIYHLIEYTHLEIQFRSASYTLAARICKNFEENKPCW